MWVSVTGEAICHTWTVCLSVIDVHIVQVYCQYQLAVSVKAVLREICIKIQCAIRAYYD